MLLGQNSKFPPSSWVKIYPFSFEGSIFYKCSSLRSQTFLNFRSIHLSYPKLVGTPCNHIQNALARYGDSTSTSSKGRDVHDNTRNTSSEFSLQSSAAGEKQLTNFLLPWRFQIHFDILKGFAFHAWSSSVKNISCILNFFPGYVLHPVKMYPSLGLTGSSNIYLKCCLKRSEGGRRPTERSVFKFFFVRLA